MPRAPLRRFARPGELPDCGDYPCDRIRDRLITFEELTAGKQVSEKDREDFIRPYENRARIDAMREENRRS